LPAGEERRAGQKSGAGFYKKEGKAIKVLDPKTGTYVDGGSKADELVGRILKRPPAERLKLLRESEHPQAQFLWSIFRDVFHYIGVHLESVADNARDIDLAIRWGFGWKRRSIRRLAIGWLDASGEVGAGRYRCRQGVVESAVAFMGLRRSGRGTGRCAYG